jgi:hypothetical protein
MIPIHYHFFLLPPILLATRKPWRNKMAFKHAVMAAAFSLCATPALAETFVIDLSS